jgi:hypothetical protein
VVRHRADEQPLIRHTWKGKCTTLVTKLGLYVCGLCCAGYCAWAAYRFNAAQAQGTDGYVFAGVMAALAVGNLLLFSSAAARWHEGKKRAAIGCGAGWLVILTIVLLNSAGFTVGGRLTAVSGRSTEIKTHERSQQAFDEAIGALAQAHGDVQWKDTAACTSVMTKAHRAFCSRVDRLEADKNRFDAELQQAPPGASDAQASLVSSVTGWSSETSGSVLSVVTAIVLEFAAAWMLLAADTIVWPSKPKMVAPEAATKIEPTLEPEKPTKRRRRRVRKRQEPPRKLVLPKPPLTLVR